MCGRFSLRALLDDLRRHLHEVYLIDNIADDIWVPKYNVAPGQEVLAVINDGAKNRVGRIKWGYVPFFAKDNDRVQKGIINAKAETLAQKPAFRGSLSRKRCVILADGFYEWKTESQEKQPMRITMKDESVFALAGIWETSIAPDGKRQSGCAIVTTEPNELMASIHNRMPVILGPEARRAWLDPSQTDPLLLVRLLTPFIAAEMTAYPVSPLINRPGVEGPDLILPLRQS
ncbi:MAG TPA: SOS response-associated peptidase [Candidatus Izemoplasmatales bacterium]|nr:SOS response-associated peptidase [Candidatus Izemoplasmatales bacterium]